MVLQTDYGLEKDGFELVFEATDCPNNCTGFGTCTSGVCTSCPASRKGAYCEEEWCPMQCNSLLGKGFCDVVSLICFVVIFGHVTHIKCSPFSCVHSFLCHMQYCINKYMRFSEQLNYHLNKICPYAIRNLGSAC